MVGVRGFELLTSCSQSRRATGLRYTPTETALNLAKCGSTTWTRTRDPVINSHLLYQLSYRGMSAMLLIRKRKSSRAEKNPACSSGCHLRPDRGTGQRTARQTRVSGASYAPILLSVPDRSRASSLPRPLARIKRRHICDSDATEPHALPAATANAVLFNRDGIDDAECDVSDG